MSTERTSNPVPGTEGRLASLFREVLGNRGFVACIALLATLAVSFEVLAIWKGIRFRKEPLYLKKPLKELDHDRLRPYGFVGQVDLPPESVNQLGTEEYISWIMDDPFKADGTRADLTHDAAWGTPGWRRKVNLFVTYYTGTPDQVPHVPEVCYAGSGHREVGNTVIELDVPALGDGATIPVVVLKFRRDGMHGTSKRIVMYTFHANGEFRPSRTDVRRAVGNPWTRYAYFSKLEVSTDVGGAYRTMEQAIEAGKRFLRVVVPVLLEDHWPDWEAAVRQAEPQPDAGGAAATRPVND